MIIQFESTCNENCRAKVLNFLDLHKYTTKSVITQHGDYLIGIGNSPIDIRSIGNMKGIKDVHAVNDKHELVSSKWKVGRSQIALWNNKIIGGDELSIMAGPCSIESFEQIDVIVDFLATHHIKIMRGGVFKPRSSPYAFRGIGIEGLIYFYNKCHENNICVITEVMQVDQIDAMYDYVDIFQVGARNSQNYTLLDALGKLDKPVMIKRGLSGTIDELLYSAEYIFSGGNEEIILCERGIRTYEKAYRNTFDLNAIPILKKKSHLPVIADPSHGTGIRELVEPMALAAIMSGADGIMAEIHPHPEQALSDGQQSLDFQDATKMINKMRQTYKFKKRLHLK